MADFFIEQQKGRNILTDKIREGDLYQILNVSGEYFEIRYGFYDEKDRISKYNDPIPIYPNFLESPQYNDEGDPFVTEMQDTCEHFKGNLLVDICCGCSHYEKGDDLIGICRCPKRKQNHNNEGDNL